MALQDTWQDIKLSQVDQKSPLVQALSKAIRKNLRHLKEVLYGSYTPTSQHTHNGIDSPVIGTDGVGTDAIENKAVTGAKIDDDTVEQGNIAANAVGRSELKTTSGYTSGSIGGSSFKDVILSHDYVFFPNFYSVNETFMDLYFKDSGSEAGNPGIGIENSSTGESSYTISYYYLTSSYGPRFTIMKSNIGKIEHIDFCEDDDRKIGSEKYNEWKQTWEKQGYKVIEIDASVEQMRDLVKTAKEKKKDIFTIFQEDYEIEEKRNKKSILKKKGEAN